MIAANKDRTAGAEEASRLADQRHKEAMAAHAETMAAIKAQAEADQNRRAEAMAAFDVQRQALETLIERTAPPRASDR